MADPDALRQQILDDTLTWEKAEPHGAVEHEAAERISSAFAALDHHLRHGGYLPRAWAGARRLSAGGQGGFAHGGPPAAGNTGGAGGGGGRAWDYDQDGEPQRPSTGTGNLMGPQDPARHGGYIGGGQSVHTEPGTTYDVTAIVEGGEPRTVDMTEKLPERRRRLLGRW